MLSCPDISQVTGKRCKMIFGVKGLFIWLEMQYPIFYSINSEFLKIK